MAKRLIEIHYPYEKKLVDRLDACLSMCCMPFVIFDDKIRYTIYIDKGGCTWKQVITEINRVHATKIRYVNDCHIEKHFDGKHYVHQHC